MVYKKGGRLGDDPPTSEKEQKSWSASDKEVTDPAEMAVKIERHYGHPIDIEWARDDGKLYIVQARPETVASQKKDTRAMMAVVSEEALSESEHEYLEFTDKFESKFLTQGAYENRDIFTSPDVAWTLLRIFPQGLLKKIPQKLKDEFYDRENENLVKKWLDIFVEIAAK